VITIVNDENRIVVLQGNALIRLHSCENSKHANVRRRQRLNSSIRQPLLPSQTATLRHSLSCRLGLASCPMKLFLTSFSRYVPLYCCHLMMIQLLFNWLSSPQRRKWYRSVYCRTLKLSWIYVPHWKQGLKKFGSRWHCCELGVLTVKSPLPVGGLGPLSNTMLLEPYEYPC